MKKTASLFTPQDLRMPAIGLVTVLLALVGIVNANIPMIGHDYAHFIPRMLDGYLHQKINGFNVQWYTPSFGGGTPAYPNPQDLQYSFPQLLMFFIDPWKSLMISISTYSILGFITFYLFLKNVCGITQISSTLGAIFIIANGFFINHAVVGHVGFQVFPLLGCILLPLFSRRLGWLESGISIGIIGFLMINQASFYNVFIFGFSLMILIPFLYLVKPHLFDWKRLAAVSFAAGAFALAFSASKLWAVYSFMRFFSREIGDFYNKPYLDGLTGIAAQLSGGMILIPLYLASGRDLNDLHEILSRYTGATGYKFWETDISISPILIFILVYGMIRLSADIVRKRINIFPSRRQVWAVAFLMLGAWLTIDFSLANGWLYDFLRNTPVIRSLHVNVRFTAAFIFPLALAGAFIIDRYGAQITGAEKRLFALLGLPAILFMLIYTIPGWQVYRQSFDIRGSIIDYSRINNGERFPVRNIKSISDSKVFKENASNLKGYFDPIFGYELESFHPEIHEGSVFNAEDSQYYNMTNPASYVFPKENGLRPFERFHTSQAQELLIFVNRGQPHQKISSSQHIANYTSLLSLIGSGLYISIKTGRRIYLYRLRHLMKTQ